MEGVVSTTITSISIDSGDIFGFLSFDDETEHFAQGVPTNDEHPDSSHDVDDTQPDESLELMDPRNDLNPERYDACFYYS